jgi:CRP-like cAMP-binding protein/tetratricopeptide (TPR) repeat protein
VFFKLAFSHWEMAGPVDRGPPGVAAPGGVRSGQAERKRQGPAVGAEIGPDGEGPGAALPHDGLLPVADGDGGSDPGDDGADRSSGRRRGPGPSAQLAPVRRRWEHPPEHAFWSALGAAQQDAFAASAQEQIFWPGSVLCHEDDTSTEVMVIESGWTKVSVRTGRGERIIAVRGPGDIVGERAALTARARSATVTALGEVTAMVVPASRFAAFLTEHPRALETLERQLSERLADDRARLATAEPDGAERRLAWLLVELALHRGGHERSGAAAITLPMSHRELADWADARPDAVARYLRAWRDRGIVQTRRRQLAVLDVAELERLSGAVPAPGPAGPPAAAPVRVARQVTGPSGVRPDTIGWAGLNCSILMTDVAGFGAAHRDDGDRRAIRRVLYELLPAAFDEAGLHWDRCYHEDRGDGVLVIIPPSIATSAVVHPLLALLAAKLRRYNRRASAPVRIQLRAAIEVGPVVPDAEGLSGLSIIRTARMLDATLLKNMLAQAGADLAVIVSTYVYDTVIRHRPGDVDPATYQRVVVEEKESQIAAWVWLTGGITGGPGPAGLPGPERPGQRGRPATGAGQAQHRGRAQAIVDGLPVAAPFGALPAQLRGRDGLLTELCGQLTRRARRRGAAWVLAGLGGLGKSTVALAAAKTARGRGWRVWWVTATDSASLTGGMLEILRQLRAPESVTQPVRAGAPTAADRAWEFLNGAHPAGRRWLLIFDNADQPAVLTADGTGSPADGTGWLRPDPAGMVIVTTRTRDPRVWGAAVVLRELQPFDDATAAQALADLAPEVADPAGQQARRLGHRLGGLPLALHLAGAYLASPFARWHSFADYHRALDSTSLPAALADLGEGSAQARANIQRTWDLSLTGLADQGRPQARPLLFVLCCYAPATPIPGVLLQPGMLTGPAADGQDRAGDEPWRRFRAALRGLAAVGLIDTAHGGGTGGTMAVAIHPVVADAIRSQLLTTSRASLPVIGQTAVALLRTAADGLDDRRPADWPDWQRLIPHITAVLSWLAPELVPATLEDLVGIGCPAADALWRSGNLAAAADLATASVAAAGRLSPDRPAVLRARHTLGKSITGQGRYGEAEQLYRQLLADQSRALGDDHPDTLATRHRLGFPIAAQGRYQEAEELYRQLLIDWQRIRGDADPATMRTRHNLATVIADQGRYAEAENLYHRVLADSGRVLGDDHPDTLGIRHRLGWVIAAQGRAAEAEDLYHELLADQRRILGDEHPATLATGQRLAWVIAAQGRAAEAERLYRQVLADQQRILGDSHPATLVTRRCVADCLAARSAVDDS